MKKLLFLFVFPFFAIPSHSQTISGQINLPCTPTLPIPIFSNVAITDIFLNLTCNVTSSSIVGNFQTGYEIVLTITQAGSNTFTWPSNFVASAIPQIPGGAGLSTASTWQYCGPLGFGASCPAGFWQNTDQAPAGIPSNGNTFYPISYGVKADTYSVVDAVCSNGSNIVTSASAHFQTTAKISVGQTVWTIPGGGTGNNPPSIPKTTILSIDSDTQIHTTANGNAGCGANQFLVWGDDDFPAFHNNLEPAFYAQTGCGLVVLPAGGIMISGGVVNKPEPASCPSGLTIASYGMVGQSITNSVFYPTPDFDPTTCTGSGKTNCIGPPDGPKHDFGIQGGGVSATANPATVFNVFTANSPANVYNVSCLYWASNQTNMTGFNTTSGQMFQGPNLQFANCGANTVTWTSGTFAGNVIGGFWVPNGGSVTIASATPGLDFFSNFIGGSGVNECGVNVSGFAHSFGLFTSVGVEGCVPGGTFTVNGMIASHNQGIAGRAALKITAGGKVFANNSSFSDPGAGEFAVSVDATSKFTDSCGNSYTGNINVSAGGIFIPCKYSIYPSDPSHPTVTGTGACATITTQTGTMYYGTFKCTGATAASTITITPGGPNATNTFQGRASDITTTANSVLSTGGTNSTATFSAASITANDVISFDIYPQ